MINHHQNSYYSFSLNTYKEISISLDSLYARDLGGMKSRKKNYKIRKSVASDPGPEKTYSSSSPLIHSLIIMYLEAINAFLKHKLYMHAKDHNLILWLFFF